MANLIYKKEFSNIEFEVWDDRPQLEELEIIQVHQIHSDIITRFHKGNTLDNNIKADGIITKLDILEKKFLAIKTADCLPILLMNKEEVALIHAGWKGVEQQIYLQEVIKQMKPSYCFIGPCISKNAFEVQQDFTKYFQNSDNFIYKENKIYFDLISQVKQELLGQFPQLIVEDSGLCTLEDKKFNSFRRNKTTKRNYNILKLRY